MEASPNNARRAGRPDLTAVATEVTTGRPTGEKPKLVVFYSFSSGACRRMDGYLAHVLHSRLNREAFDVVRVDVEQRPDLAERFRVEKVPTICIVEQRRLRKRIEGAMTATRLRRELQDWLH
jgi:thioredoxin-like negative regulator of GroEL